jgi:hypothetical protein
VEFVEAFLGEVLVGVRKNEVAVADTPMLFLSTRVKDRGVDKGHTRNVGIGFGRYVESACPGSFDHREALQGITQTGAIDVHDVERSACDGGRCDEFTHGFDRGSGLGAARTAYVGVNRHPPLGGQTEHINDL